MGLRNRKRYSKKRYSKKRYSKKRYSKKRYSRKRYRKTKRRNKKGGASGPPAVCPHGDECFNLNEAHRAQHPPGWKPKCKWGDECFNFAEGHDKYHRDRWKPKVRECDHGEKCFNSDATHSKQFSHPDGWPSWKLCEQGTSCVNKDPDHLREFGHPSRGWGEGWGESMADLLTLAGQFMGETEPAPAAPAASAAAPAAAEPNQVVLLKLFSQGAAHQESQTDVKTGILIAGNAGLPGGDLGIFPEGGHDYRDGRGTKWTEPRYYNTQEESVVSSWLHANNEVDVQELFRRSIGDKAANPEGEGDPSNRLWGLTDPDAPVEWICGAAVDPSVTTPWGCNMKGTLTLQGYDYTEPFLSGSPDHHIEKYNFCHSVPNQDIYHYDNYGRRAAVAGQPDEPPSGPIKFNASLYFTFGPNVAASGTPQGSMAKTLVAYYVDDQHHYNIFKACVKQAYKTSLEMMSKDGIQVPILCRLSGGIYSRGQTRVAINKGYEAIIKEIVKEAEPMFNFTKIILCG